MIPPRPERFVPSITLLEDRTTPTTLMPDPSFGSGGRLTLDLGPNDIANAVAVQSDGKIVIAGTSGNDGDFVIARLNPNGVLDSTFDDDGVRYIDFNGRRDVATDITVLSNGRIVVSGTSTDDTGSSFAVARLNADGSNDTSFATTGQRLVAVGTDATSSDMLINPFGDIYLGGTSGGDFAVVRLDPFGVVDKGYGVNGIRTVDLGGTDVATSINLLNDGRLYIAGYTNAANPAATSNDFVTVRLSADGELVDFGFGTTTLNGNKASIVDFGGDDQAFASALTADGGLVLAGTDGGIDANFAVARLTAFGTLDTTFDTDGQATFAAGGLDVATSVLLDGSGRIFVGGSTTPDRSTDANFTVIRLTSSGTLDSTANSSRVLDFGGNDVSSKLTLDASQRLVVVGKTSNNIGIARLGSQPGIDPLLLVSGTPDGSGVQYMPDTAGQFAKGEVFNVFPGFTGTIRVATADINGDGVPDQIAGAGPGTGSVVAAYDGATGKLLANFFAFEPSFTGGVFVASGDFTGDGLADVVVTADIGGGPRVRIFDGAKLSVNNPTVIADFFGIEDPSFRGGARAAVGDLNADGTPDLVVMAGPDGGPRVSIYNGQSIASGAPIRLLADFFAFEPALRNGAYATIGDFNGDGFGDLVLGAGLGGAPRVRVISGAELLRAETFTTLDSIVGVQLANFIAGDPNSRSGVRVAVKDVDSDGLPDLVTGSGPNQTSEVRVYRAAELLTTPADPAALQIFNPFSVVLPKGVFVG